MYASNQGRGETGGKTEAAALALFPSPKVLKPRLAVPNRSRALNGCFHQMAVAPGRCPSAFSSLSTLPGTATRIRQENKLYDTRWLGAKQVGDQRRCQQRQRQDNPGCAPERLTCLYYLVPKHHPHALQKSGIRDTIVPTQRTEECKRARLDLLNEIIID